MNGRLKNWLEGGVLHLLLELTLVAAVAVMLAHWTWIVASPSARATAPSSSADAEVRIDIPSGLFGGLPSASRGEAAAGAGVRLLGVVSPKSGNGGKAVLRLDAGGARAAGVGETVAPGVVLKEVHADHVVLERNGALERLRLERRTLAPAGPRTGR